MMVAILLGWRSEFLHFIGQILLASKKPHLSTDMTWQVLSYLGIQLNIYFFFHTNATCSMSHLLTSIWSNYSLLPSPDCCCLLLDATPVIEIWYLAELQLLEHVSMWIWCPFSRSTLFSLICTVFLIKLKQKIASATSAIKSVFGQEQTQDDAVSILHLDLVFIRLLYKVRNILYVLSYVGW